MTSNDDKKPSLRVISGTPPPEQEDAKTAPAEADNDEGLLLRLTEYEQEHKDLDFAIAAIEERMPYDRISLQRMKKRKLVLKDKIVELKDKLHPDIIA